MANIVSASPPVTKNYRDPLPPPSLVKMEHPTASSSVADFLKQWMPREYIIELKGKWHDSKAEGRLLGYIQEFRTLVQIVPDVSEDERWNELQYKIDQRAKDHLALHNVTTSMEALDVLYDYALGIEMEERKKKSVGITKDSDGNGKRPMEMDGNKGGKRKKVDKSNFDHIQVDMQNYDDFNVLPCITKNLEAFLDFHKGCWYCRKLGVPLSHTPTTCSKESRAWMKGGDLKDETSSIKTLEVLYECALAHEKDIQRKKLVAINHVGTGDGNRPAEAMVDGGNKGLKRKKVGTVLPCVTGNLAVFLDLQKECRYCRKLNVPSTHAPETCSAAKKAVMRRLSYDNGDHRRTRNRFSTQQPNRRLSSDI